MLDYTKTAVRQTVEDFKKADYIRDVATQAFYIAYLTYALIARAGVFFANIALAVLSVAYFIFFLCITKAGKDIDAKPSKKAVAMIYRVCKKLITLYTLGVAIYSIYVTASNVSVTSLLLTVALIVGWILQIVFDLIIRVFVSRVNLLTEALEADVQSATKPVRAIGNFFKKVTGQEVTPEKEPTKTRLYLDKKVAERREEERQRKLREKQEKKERKKLKAQKVTPKTEVKETPPALPIKSSAKPEQKDE